MYIDTVSWMRQLEHAEKLANEMRERAHQQMLDQGYELVDEIHAECVYAKKEVP